MPIVAKISFFIVFFFISILAQENFHNVYSILGDNSKALKIKKLGNGGFTSLCSINSMLYEIIFSQSGEIKDTIPLILDLESISNIDFTIQGDYVILRNEKNGGTTDYYLTVTNSNNDILLDQLIFSRTGDYAVLSILPTSKGNYLVSYVISESSSDLNVLYLRQNGEMIWQAIFSNSPSERARYPLMEMNDSTFLVSSRNKVINVTAAGDSLWSYDTGNIIYAVDQFDENDNIIIGSAYSIQKISSSGIPIAGYENNTLRELNTLTAFDNNSAIFFVKDIYYLLTPSVELEKEERIRTNVIDAFTENNRLFAIGDMMFEKGYSNIKNISTVSWDVTENNSKRIILISPNGGEFFPNEAYNKVDKLLTLIWYSEGINSVKIEFSQDKGDNWQDFEVIAPTSTEYTHRAEIPYVNSDSCLIRVSDLNDPSIFDISTNVFSVRPYKFEDYIAGNNCMMWIGNDGMSSHHPISDDSGFFWPDGENAEIASIFSDGIVWGGMHKGMIKAGGATYRYGLIPGAILENGSGDNPSKNEYSVFKLKKNWESLPPGLEKEKMLFNYQNWPGQHGATFVDKNNDGIFNRNNDEPEIIGEETLFYVANDLDSSRTEFLFGSPPIGLEFQQTLFAYNTPELNDAVFKRIRLINKSGHQIDSMFVGYWADQDLGYAGDDFAGCDTVLNMMYVYNGDNMDEDYYGTAPPAVGHLLLQGPIVESSENDTAKYKRKFIKGYKNAPIYSHYFWDHNGRDGIPVGSYDGTLELYGILKGIFWSIESNIDPNTGDTTRFMVAGDPLNRTGWYEGDGWPGGPVPNDRRTIMSSGPFTMAPGDTQEVVYAIFMARGSDNIQSVAELKKSARLLHEFWGNEIPVSVEVKDNEIIPARFSLSQNYPNPFNPSTTIRYTIPSNVKSEKPAPTLTGSIVNSEKRNGETKNEETKNGVGTAHELSKNTINVELKIYDILGREVATLVNQKQKPGSYEVLFNGSNYASGMYFYRLHVYPADGGAGNYSAVKKMMLLK